MRAEPDSADANEALEVLARLEAILAMRVDARLGRAPVTAKTRFDDVFAACTPWWGLAPGVMFGIAVFLLFPRVVALALVIIGVNAITLAARTSRTQIRRALFGAVVGLLAGVWIAVGS